MWKIIYVRFQKVNIKMTPILIIFLLPLPPPSSLFQSPSLCLFPSSSLGCREPVSVQIDTKFCDLDLLTYEYELIMNVECM